MKLPMAEPLPGRHIKARRRGMGLTQAELARGLGVDVETVGRWERDMRGCPAFLALALDSIEYQLALAEEGP